MTNIRRALEAAAATGGDATYVEDVFSTYVYEGNGSTGQTITNGIDLDGEGGMVWFKCRSIGFGSLLFDTVRGTEVGLASDATDAEASYSSALSSFNSDGFTLQGNVAQTNESGADMVGWTFRKAPGFFDIQTYTGNGVAGRTVAHNLESVPGMVIVKTLATGGWQVYHRSNTAEPETEYLILNSTAATGDYVGMWNDTLPTSSVVTLGDDNDVNGDTVSFVMYLFAHDAQEFGAGSDESIIKCGGFTTTGLTADISLGFEPQFVMTKSTSTTDDWRMFDNMRGMTTQNGDDALLLANSTDAENNFSDYISPSANGFSVANYASGADFIYIAIRRGPMKVPEAGTEVFTPIAYSGTQASTQNLSFSMVPDVTTIKLRNAVDNNYIQTRLNGANFLQTNEQDGRSSSATEVVFFDVVQKGIQIPGIAGTQIAGVNGPASSTYVCEAFQRAPGFLDICTWPGTDVAHTIPHNLTVVPEMMWVKRTDGNAHWAVYANNENTKYAVLDTSLAAGTGAAYWNSTSPTSSVFTVGTHGDTNASTENFCAWLWATLAGVSKVGSYTGTGSDQNIDCGFSSSARYVMLKPWDAAGDWIYLDSARGLTTTPTEPYLRYNTNAIEITSYDYVRGHVSGFSVIGNQTTSNNSGTTYIFLAIA